MYSSAAHRTFPMPRTQPSLSGMDPMKKLRLDLDSLHVESFSPSRAPGEDRGTVEGHGESQYGSCPSDCTCSYPTWYNECHETVTYGENTCYCQIPITDARYCNTERDCSGGGMC